MKLLRFCVLALVALSGLPTRAAAPFEYMPVLTNLINFPISTNIPPGLLPANRVTAFLGGITTTNERPLSGFYIFMADSVRATNAPTIGGTNVFRSIYWDTKTSQTSTGRWEQVSWDIALADVISAGGPIGNATTSPVITWDSKGRLVNVTSAAITYPGSFSGFANPSATVGPTAVNGSATTAMRSDGAPALANTAVTLGSYGSATQVGTFTVDAQGRLTAAANVTITGAAPGGAAGGGLSGTYPDPNVNLSATTFIIGDLPLSNIVQIANNSILGNFTGGTADIQVLTSITSANLAQILSNETGGGVAVFNDNPTFVTGITTPAATISSMTSGSILFSGGSGLVSQDNANLFWDDANNRFGIGTSSPASKLHLVSSVSSGTGYGMILDLSGAATTLNGVYLAVSGAVNNRALYIESGQPGSGANNYAIYSASEAQSYFAGSVGIGTATPLAKLAVNGGISIGDDTDPGDNNARITGTLLLAPMTPTSIPFIGTGGLVVQDNAKLQYLSTPASIGLGGSADSQIGVAVTRVGAKSLTDYGVSIVDSATSSTDAMTKAGLYVQSTGTWNGAGSVNYAVLINGASGGTANWALYNNSGAAVYLGTGDVSFGGTATYSTQTASTIATFNGSKQLVSGSINPAALSPKYITGDPNFLGTSIDGEGQMAVNTATGERWWAKGTEWWP